MSAKCDNHSNDVIEDGEVYEGLLIARALASYRKIEAGLNYAGSGQYQDYPRGIIELGVAKDALLMFLTDILKFVEINRKLKELR